MSYTLTVLKDNPMAYWKLGHVDDFEDIGGNGYHASNVSTNINPRPIVANNIRALASTSATSVTASLPNVLLADRENMPVTIEAWAYPTSFTGTATIAGRASSGLFQVDNAFVFTLANNVAESFSARYIIPRLNKIYYLVAVYAGGNMTLYVDGVPVSGNVFTGTFSDSSVTFRAPLGFVGAMSDVAIYNKVLNNNIIVKHYQAGTNTVGYPELVMADDGIYFPLDDESATVEIDYLENSEEQWLAGTLSNVQTHGNSLVPSDASAGNRISPLIDIGMLGIIDGSRINWDTSLSDTIIETSLDNGSIWSVATNNSTIPGIGAGTDVTDKLLLVRVTFPASARGPEPAGLSRLHLVIYSNKDVTSSVSEYYGQITEPASLAEHNNSPINVEEFAHVVFTKPGKITIPFVSSEEPISSIEFWIKRNSREDSTVEHIIDTTSQSNSGGIIRVDSDGTLFSSGFSGIYINKSLVTPTINDFVLGKWVHVVAILPAGSLNDININSNYSGTETSNASYANISLYPSQLSQNNVVEHFNGSYGRNTYSLVDSSLLAISEFDHKVYTYPWQIQGGGG